MPDMSSAQPIIKFTDGAGEASGSGAALMSARSEMRRILDPPPPPGIIGYRKTHITPSWRHGPVRADFSPMDGYVLIHHYTAAQSVRLRLGDNLLEGFARPGSFSVLPPGCSGQLVISDKIRVSHLYIDRERFAEAGSGVLAAGVGIEDAAVCGLLRILGDLAASPGDIAAGFVDEMLVLLLARLRAAHATPEAPSNSGRYRGLADWQVKRVTAFIRNHLDETIELSALASLVGLSRYYFCTAFKAATGQTPHEWLVSERIRQSQSLLSGTPLSITEIALTVGYKTPSAFSASFRNLIGVSPSAFRRQADRKSGITCSGLQTADVSAPPTARGDRGGSPGRRASMS